VVFLVHEGLRDEDLRDLVDGGGEGVGRYLVVVGRQERLDVR
jgi:hypothetical protein